MLKHFGCERSDKPLGWLINTDLSAKIKVNPARNGKNDVVWSTSRPEAGDILNSNEEKFSVGEMVWGGISWWGLVPAEKPVFVSDLQKKFEPTTKSVNGHIYAYLVENIKAPAVRELYPDVSAIWQQNIWFLQIWHYNCRPTERPLARQAPFLINSVFFLLNFVHKVKYN